MIGTKAAPIVGPRTHAAWLGSIVFDGARAFEGSTPDLDHGINFVPMPIVNSDTWLGPAREGIARLPPRAELYIRPMYWAQHVAGDGELLDPDISN